MPCKNKIPKAVKTVALSTCMLLLLCTHNGVSAQEKYFQVITQKAKDYLGKYVSSGGIEIVAPHDKYNMITLNYQGKTSTQLFSAVMNYLKSFQRFYISNYDSSNSIKYRDFCYIGKKDSCMADLIAMNFFTVYTMENKIKFHLDEYNIYSTVNGAQLGITEFGELYSQNNVPFGAYEFVQPAPYKDQTYNSGGLVGLLTKKAATKHEPGLAYPESIYDSKGNIVNPNNKRILEAFFNNYLIGLKNYVDKSLQ